MAEEGKNSAVFPPLPRSAFVLPSCGTCSQATVCSSFVFLTVTTMYFQPTLGLTHSKAIEETRDSKKMLLKIKIDEEEPGNSAVVLISCLCLHLGRSTRKRRFCCQETERAANKFQVNHILVIL